MATERALATVISALGGSASSASVASDGASTGLASLEWLVFSLCLWMEDRMEAPPCSPGLPISRVSPAALGILGWDSWDVFGPIHVDAAPSACRNGRTNLSTLQIAETGPKLVPVCPLRPVALEGCSRWLAARWRASLKY